MLSRLTKILPVFLLVLLTIFSRFYCLDWGNGYFFHPDENNMASAVFQMSSSSLNPHFFAYGQFPLFLTFFTTPQHQFSSIVFTLRFWSAFFSSLSIFIFYLIGLKLFKSTTSSFIFALLIIFTPGLIQLSHFGTTESILIFVFAANIYLSQKILEKLKFQFLFLAGFISGIGLATKISAAIFLLPVFLSLFLVFLKNKNLSKFFIRLFLFSVFTVLVFFIFSPYNFLDFNSFKSSMSYEIGVANGQTPIFYTRQFIGTIPYVFQFEKIFPYTNGVFILLFSFFGIFNLPKKSKNIFLVLISSIIFFLYQGQLFVKWTRFMSPIFFIFPLLSVYFIQKIKNTFLKTTLILICLLPGIYFFRIYFQPDIRIQASNWINQNIPPHSQVLSESGNVIDLPLANSKINVSNFDFYQLDQSFEQQENLKSLIKNSDYIFIPSRRVFKNQNNFYFPISQDYYQKLFSGNLNFSSLKTFSTNNSFLLNSQNAEETWSVFDNSTIRIFKKNNL